MDTNTEKQSANGSQKVVLIERKSAFDFEAIKKRVEVDHWRKFRVEIQIREKMHGGKPAQLDAAKAMLKARGLEDVVEAREALIPTEERAITAVDEGLCQFHRREGKEGIWFPSQNAKAMLKENASVLGYNMDARPKAARKAKPDPKEEAKDAAAVDAASGKALRGLRGALHEGLFVMSCDPADQDWIYLGEKADGVDQNPCHTIGPSGPQSSIKRNEYLWKPKFAFEVWIAKAVQGKLHDEVFVDILLHAQEHGVGANRGQGVGRFDVVSCVEI